MNHRAGEGWEDSWEPATEPCGVGWDDFLKGWVGVICVEEGGAVVSVALPDTGIGGLILPALGRLLELRYLNLRDCPRVRGDIAVLAALGTIARFPLITLEKWQGMDLTPYTWQEDAWVTAARQIKQRNPAATVLVWCK